MLLMDASQVQMPPQGPILDSSSIASYRHIDRRSRPSSSSSSPGCPTTTIDIIPSASASNPPPYSSFNEIPDDVWSSEPLPPYTPQADPFRPSQPIRVPATASASDPTPARPRSPPSPSLRRLQRQSPLHLGSHRGSVKCVAFSPCGQLVSSGGYDHRVRLWSLASSCERALPSFKIYAGPVLSVEFAPRSHTQPQSQGELLICSAGGVSVLDIETGASRAGARQDRVSRAEWTNDGKGLFVVRDDRLDVWDTRSRQGQRVGSLEWGSIHGGRFTAASSSSDGLHVVSAATYRGLQLWDLRMSQHPFLNNQEIRAPINDLLFSPDGQHLFSASSDRKVRSWDRESLFLRQVFTGHKSAVMRMAVTNDGKRIVSAGTAERSVKVWDVKTGKSLGKTLHSGLRALAKSQTVARTSVAWSPKGDTIVTGSSGGDVEMWKA